MLSLQVFDQAWRKQILSQPVIGENLNEMLPLLPGACLSLGQKTAISHTSELQ